MTPSGRTKQRTLHGQPVTDEQTLALADEPEAGYDLPALRKRRHGRPTSGDGPGKPVTVRFDEQTLTGLRTGHYLDYWL